MRHLIDFIFLAILVDIASGCPSWSRQAFRGRLGLVGLYVIASLALWITARWLLIPWQFDQMTSQTYIFIVLGMMGVAGLAGVHRLCADSEAEHSPLLLGAGVLTLLGIPLLDHAGRLPLLDYLLPVAGTGLGWLAISYVMSILKEELHAEGVPRLMHGRCGLILVAGIFYWALMGFFNVGFI